ncbi:N-acetyltransferase O1 (Establishment of cohesion protein 1) [Cadophora gregata f. sp. sojae]|nr:N-acetyltransferase O1 (Establishment of cohesion protein 1) [Cadophora gregata f. sp. sojae]
MSQGSESSQSVCSQCIDDYICHRHQQNYPLSDHYAEEGGESSSQTCESGVGTPNATSSPIPIPRLRAQRMTQSQLSLGNTDSQVVCEECGSRYDKTLTEDRASHSDMHEERINCGSSGVNLCGVTLQGGGAGVTYFDGKKLFFIRVKRNDAAVVRSFARRVVEKVDGELGYPKVDDMWSETENPDPEFAGKSTERFQVFIAMVDRRPVAAIIAEPIVRAVAFARILKPGQGGNGEEEVHRDHVVNDIVMSVDRIWVDEKYRRGAFHGVHLARILLDIARSHFVGSYTIPRARVAFSRPTNQGYKFACDYFRGSHDQLFPDIKATLLINVDSETPITRMRPAEITSQLQSTLGPV